MCACSPGRFIGAFRPIREMIRPDRVSPRRKEARRPKCHSHVEPTAREVALFQFRYHFSPASVQMLLLSFELSATQVSRTTSDGFLSSRMATKVQCLRCPASVHSRKATWQTSFGLTHRHSCIFSAVNDSPQREALFSGRFLKGHWAVCRDLRAGNNSSRIRGTNPFLTFAVNMSRLLS